MTTFVLDAQLRALIEVFGSRNGLAEALKRPQVSQGQCEAVSAAFLFFLKEHGVQARLLRCWDKNDDHVVVQIGEVVVDWTLRQFEPEAAVPAVFESADRQRWPNFHEWLVSKRFVQDYSEKRELEPLFRRWRKIQERPYRLRSG